MSKMEKKDILDLLTDIGVEIPEEKKTEFNTEFRKSYKSVVEFNNKVSSLTTERDDYKTKYDELLTSNNSNDTQIQQLTTELEDYKTKYETANNALVFEKNQTKVLDAGIDKKFAKFVISEVSTKVDDKVDFDNALQNYIKENPQYKIEGQNQGNGTKVVKVNSSLSLGGEGTGATDVNSIMNNYLLKATGRK